VSVRIVIVLISGSLQSFIRWTRWNQLPLQKRRFCFKYCSRHLSLCLTEGGPGGKEFSMTCSAHVVVSTTVQSMTFSAHSVVSTTVQSMTCSAHVVVSTTVQSTTFSAHSVVSTTVQSMTCSAHAVVSTTVQSMTCSAHAVVSTTVQSMTCSAHAVVSTIVQSNTSPLFAHTSSMHVRKPPRRMLFYRWIPTLPSPCSNEVIKIRARWQVNWHRQYSSFSCRIPLFL
jgi:hypothetical protein